MALLFQKKMKIVDYTMFLPEEIKDLGHYIDLIFEGFTFFLAKYNVPESTVSGMKDECKRELELV